MSVLKIIVLIVISIIALVSSLGVGIYANQVRPKAERFVSSETGLLETDAPKLPWSLDPQQPGGASDELQAARQAYDVVVFGGTPEGVAAALSSARHGLKTCLVSEKGTLGGVWANAQLNQLDNTYEEVSAATDATATATYSLTVKGINEGFMRMLGIKRMENGFYDGVFDANKVKPLFQQLLDENEVDHITFEGFSASTSERRVRSIEVRAGTKTQRIRATYFIDASENGDLAADVGCPYTLGRGRKVYGTPDRPVRQHQQDYGADEKQMSATLMFRLGAVDWDYLSNAMHNGTIDKFARSGNAGWGYNLTAPGFNNPQSIAQGIMLGGLNLGRQSDGSVLVNGLLVFNVDGTSKRSIQDGVERARSQLPPIINYLKNAIPAFKTAYLIDSADTLYIRESRHFIGEYVITLDDLLGGAQHYDTVATARHAVDIHPYTPEEAMESMSKYGNLTDLHLQPRLYGIPFRSLLPITVDNLVMVGKTTSCTPKAAASVRVVSTGIAEAQAAGMIIGIAKLQKRSLKDLAYDERFWANSVLE